MNVLESFTMQNSKRSFKVLKLSFLILTAIFIGASIYFANGPEVRLQLTREIHSDLSRSRIDRNLSATNRWPQWFNALQKVESAQKDPQQLTPGDILTLVMQSKKGLRSPFQLTAEVIEYVPEKILHLKILTDSSEKIFKLFDELEWKVELWETQNGTIIKGTATAHTRNWRSRLLGKFSEKIIMNQLFYPNLIQLSTLRQPFSVNPVPHLAPNSL
jgi:hypothetical protein